MEKREQRQSSGTLKFPFNSRIKMKDSINKMWEESKKPIELKDVPIRYEYRFSDKDYQRILWYDSLRWQDYPQWPSRTIAFNMLINQLHRAFWRTIVC